MKKIILVNDILTGCMGERVLWDFLLEGIPEIVGVDSRITKNYKAYIDAHHSDAKILIQNASFIGLVDENKYTISYLQDNLRAMNRKCPGQENTLKKSKLIVSNSELTAASYPEYDIKIIPIGVDNELFQPHSTSNKYEILDRKIEQEKIGIFVGALNEVKGWNEVKSIIEKRQDIFWIIVSKDMYKYDTKNSMTFNRINQKSLCQLLQKADFFIIGSPVETECLAAIEAAMCNIPIVMHNTGIFMDFDNIDRESIGYFGQNLEDGINKVLSGKYTPREMMVKHKLDVNGMIEKWKKLLLDVGQKLI